MKYPDLPVLYPVTVPVLTRHGDPAVSCELTFGKEKDGEMFKRDQIVLICLVNDIEDACIEYRQGCGYELERCEYLSTVIFAT